MSACHIVFYTDLLSQWAHLADEAIDAVRKEFASDVEIEWRIAQLNDGAPFAASLDKYAWYYRRTEFLTGVAFDPSWREGNEDSSLFTNCVAVAARRLGYEGDGVRRALTQAALRGGRHVQRRDVALEVASAASGIAREELAAAADDPRTLAEIMHTTARFRALPVEMLPCFVVSNDIGDVAILSGFYQVQTLVDIVREAVYASQRYAEFNAENPEPKP